MTAGGTVERVEGTGARRRWVAVTGAVAVALAVAGTLAAAVWLGDEPAARRPPAAAAAPSSSTAPASSAPETTQPAETASAAASKSPTPKARPAPVCNQPDHDFRPQAITVQGVTKNAGVVYPPRESGGVPGTPPVSSYGKTVFAFDEAQGIRPGDPAGNVLLNAHTWPDGTALGNHLLAGLHEGDRIVVSGGQARLCYRVTERVEVLASKGLPRYYDQDGPPQLAIVVCSGRRLGPGNWEKRTVWFASPTG